MRVRLVFGEPIRAHQVDDLRDATRAFILPRVRSG